MGITEAIAAATGCTLLDRLGRELRLNIAVRTDSAIGLEFDGDSITPQRMVYVVQQDDDPFIYLYCDCRAEFTRSTLPDGLLAAMLARNIKVTPGGWVADIDGDTVSLSLRYKALAAGVDADNFRLILDLMIAEVAEIEASLHRKGLL